MRTLPKIHVVLLSSLIAVAAVGQTQAADEKDVRAIAAQFREAWNKSDGRMLADLFLTDGDYVSSTGRTARGRAEVDVTGMRDGSGRTLGTRSGLSTIVAVRKGERWYVAALRGMVPSIPEGLGK
jgi:hypothetical protein